MSPRGFESTAWSVVLAARDAPSEVSRRALNTLCETYWFPLYSYIRHKGCSQEDAEDLTQEFLAHFLENHCLATVAPGKGKFRSYLLACLNNFLSHVHAKNQTQKRGGGLVRVPFDFAEAEQRYVSGPSHGLSAEALYDAEWGRTVLEKAMGQLEAEFAAAGNDTLFDRIRIYLSQRKADIPYKDLGRELEMSEGALKVAIHRMRKRYGVLLRNAIAETVERPEDVDAELMYLIEIVGS